VGFLVALVGVGWVWCVVDISGLRSGVVVAASSVAATSNA